MVDDVLGGVGGDVLLDGDLGDVVDGVVDGLDEPGGGHGVHGLDGLDAVADDGADGVVDGGKGSGVGHNGKAGLDLIDLDLDRLHSLDLDLGGGGGNVDGSGGNVNCGHNNGSHSLGQGVNKSVLVDVLREALEADGPEAAAG